MFITRADLHSPSSDEDHGPSDKTTQIIIGVVVGGVAAIAITAGIIFVLIKKRKWDRLKQCEERLIDYQLTSGTGYSSKLNSRSVTPEDYQVYYPMASPQPAPPPTSTMVATDPAAYPYYPQAQAQAQAQAQTGGQQDTPAIGHRARGMSAPASTTLSTLTPGQPQPQPQTRGQVVTPESPPPAYQTLHARYDPSRYSQVSTRFSSLFEGPRSSTGTVAGNPNRNTRGYTVSGMLPTTPESSSWFQQQQPYQYQPGPAVSGSASDWTSSSGAATTTTTVSYNSNNASGDSTSEERGPRRPRPVLSRLITNL